MQQMKPWYVRHAGRIALLVAGILLPLTLFGMLAEDVAEQEVLGFDHPIQMFVHAHSSAFLDAFMYWTTQAGSVLVMAPLDVLLFAWLLKRGRRRDAAFWAVSVGGAALVNWAAKVLFARTRPSLWVSSVHEISYSFPSGHVMSTMAAVTGLCLLLWPTRWRWTAVVGGSVFVFLVAMSRVYLGVHYPSDVLAGAAASLAWVTGIRLLVDRGDAAKNRAAHCNPSAVR